MSCTILIYNIITNSKSAVKKTKKTNSKSLYNYHPTCKYVTLFKSLHVDTFTTTKNYKWGWKFKPEIYRTHAPNLNEYVKTSLICWDELLNCRCNENQSIKIFVWGFLAMQSHVMEFLPLLLPPKLSYPYIHLPS